MANSFYYNAERNPIESDRGAVFKIEIYKNPTIYKDAGMLSYSSSSSTI